MNHAEESGDINMVNENWKQFNKTQKKHIGSYIGTGHDQTPGINDAEYNNQSNTDKSIGATGRELK